MSPYQPLLEQLSKEFGIEQKLLESIMIQESSGKAHAYGFEPGFYERYLKSNKEYLGAIPERVSASYGLFQVMYPVAKELGFTGHPEELFVPEISGKIACKLLKNLIQWSNGDIAKALAAYNGGKGNWKGTHPQAYAKQVLARKAKLEGK